MMVTYLIENKKASAIYYIWDHFFPLTSDFFRRRRESWAEEGVGEGEGDGVAVGVGGSVVTPGKPRGRGGAILAPTMEKLRQETNTNVVIKHLTARGWSGGNR
jgi:hypothetical protein